MSIVIIDVSTIDLIENIIRDLTGVITGNNIVGMIIIIINDIVGMIMIAIINGIKDDKDKI
jgi:Kef-type K+ transport system membrane component KefB